MLLSPFPPLPCESVGPHHLRRYPKRSLEGPWHKSMLDGPLPRGTFTSTFSSFLLHMKGEKEKEKENLHIATHDSCVRFLLSLYSCSFSSYSSSSSSSPTTLKHLWSTSQPRSSRVFFDRSKPSIIPLDFTQFGITGLFY